MGGRGSKITNPWNREGGEGHIFCNSYCVCVCEGGGGRGEGNVRRIRILPLVFMFQKCLSFWGAFTPEMPITLSFLDFVLYEIQNKETKNTKRERERERERKEKVHFWPLLIQLKDIFH